MEAKFQKDMKRNRKKCYKCLSSCQQRYLKRLNWGVWGEWPSQHFSAQNKTFDQQSRPNLWKDIFP
jgi:hypothetical protein